MGSPRCTIVKATTDEVVSPRIPACRRSREGNWDIRFHSRYVKSKMTVLILKIVFLLPI